MTQENLAAITARFEALGQGNRQAGLVFMDNAEDDVAALLREVYRLQKIEQAARELVAGLDKMSLKGFPHFERNELKKALSDEPAGRGRQA